MFSENCLYKFLVVIALCFSQIAVAQNILILGDSISAAYGIDPQQGWVHLLQAKLQREKYPYQVINASISGDTTSNGLARLPKALHDHQPKIVIVELGGNDGLRGMAVSATQANLAAMIDLCKKSNAKVMVLAIQLPPNYGPAYTDAFNQIFKTLSKEKNIPVVFNFITNVGTDPTLMQNDGIHPNAQAQKLLLQNVWPTLRGLISTKL